MTEKEEKQLAQYVKLIKPHLELAKRAYGSRNTKSPQHDASREYTRLLAEFYAEGGSLLKISKELGVTYAGMRRRIITSTTPPRDSRVRSKATAEEVEAAAVRVLKAKEVGVAEYHEALRHEYEDNDISLNKIAKAIGLSSSSPLHYGVSRAKAEK